MSALFSGLLCIVLCSCGQATAPLQAGSTGAQPLQDTCDNPDASINCSFINMPQQLTATLSIGGQDEPGEQITISGTVYKEDGRTPYPGIIIYAYHTNSKGYYAKKGTERGAQKWHGHLHGWCKTDERGRYVLKTVRPARYPDNSMPAHIHAAIKKENGQMYWISDFVFEDDDLVNAQYLTSIASLVGGTGVVPLQKNSEHSWTGKRDIVLTR